MHCPVKRKWISVLPGTFGFAQGVRYGVAAVRLTLVHPQAAALIVTLKRRGSVCQDSAFFYQKGAEQGPAAATKIREELRDALWVRCRYPAQAYHITAFARDPKCVGPFLDHFVCRAPVTHEIRRIASYGPANPISLVYDLATDEVASLTSLCGLREYRPPRSVLCALGDRRNEQMSWAARLGSFLLALRGQENDQGTEAPECPLPLFDLRRWPVWRL